MTNGILEVRVCGNTADELVTKAKEAGKQFFGEDSHVFVEDFEAADDILGEARYAAIITVANYLRR